MHMEPRYTYGGDEFLFAELAEEMSLEANFRVSAITQHLKNKELSGVVDICPANASYMVRFNPDVLSAEKLLAEMQNSDWTTSQSSRVHLSARVVDVPILFEDPWTREALMKARDRHQAPDSTDIEYAADINGYATKEDFIQALVGAPYLVSMTGFVPGLPWCFQITPRDRQIEVPKYVRPRTYTPERAFGFGGAFACIYPVQGAGGYQLFGIAPGPIFDREQRLPDFKESMVFPQPGDIFNYRAITMEEYEALRAQVEQGNFQYRMTSVEFHPDEVISDPEGFSRRALGGLYGD